MVNLKSIRGQAKVIGTITTVAGAMLMTLVKGPVLELFWTKGKTNSYVINNGVDLSHSLKGAIMITVGCFSWSGFIVLQVRIHMVDRDMITKYYDSLTSLIINVCFCNW